VDNPPKHLHIEPEGRRGKSSEKHLTEQQQIDPVIYRNGMARYAGHVQVVTTVLGGARRGVTVTAACSVSDDPPSLLVCLNSTNVNNEIFLTSGVFALNSLALHHQSLAYGFAGLSGVEPEERFALGEWQTLLTGSPVLSDAVVSLDCRVTDIRPASTHFVMFSEVVAMHFRPANPALIYLDRGFRTL